MDDCRIGENFYEMMRRISSEINSGEINSGEINSGEDVPDEKAFPEIFYIEEDGINHVDTQYGNDFSIVFVNGALHVPVLNYQLLNKRFTFNHPLEKDDVVFVLSSSNYMNMADFIIEKVSKEYVSTLYATENYYTKLDVNEAILDKTTSLGATLNGLSSKFEDVLSLETDAEGNVSSRYFRELSSSVEDVQVLMGEFTADINTLKTQQDGLVETLFGEHDVVNDSNNIDVNAEPYSLWMTVDSGNGDMVERTKHIGDTYVKYEIDGQSGDRVFLGSYRFAKLPSADVPFTDSEGFGYILMTDSSSTEALAAALNAQSTADNKINTYYVSAVPPPLSATPVVNSEHIGFSVGDMAYHSGQNNHPYRYNGTTWESLRDKTHDAKIRTMEQAISSVSGDVDEIEEDLPALTNRVNDIKSGIKNGDKDFVWANASQLSITNYNNKPLVTGFSMISGQHEGKEVSIFGIQANEFLIFTNNGYSNPFKIVNNKIVFNGLVSFSNVSGTSNVVMADDNISSLTNDAGYTDNTRADQALAAANNAQSIAQTARSTANTAVSKANAATLPSEVAAAINNNTTTVNGSKITTGSISLAKLDIGGAYGATTTAPVMVRVSGSNENAVIAISYNDRAMLASGDDGIYGAGTSLPFHYGVQGRGYYGVRGIAANSGGEWGVYTSDKIYAGKGYHPFTGAHISFSTTQCEIGDIVENEIAYSTSIDQVYTEVNLAMNAKSKKVFGVVSFIDKELETYLKGDESFSNIESEDKFKSTYKKEHLEYVNKLLIGKYAKISVNALGEGMINVCNEGGNIENGDYICSSNIKGKGMKQEDDLLHNYTVAKALEDVDWSEEDSSVKMIACTYHCG